MTLQPDWNLRLVHAPAAAALLPTTGGRVDWGDVRAAHIDTGCTRHAVFGDWAAGTQWIDLDRGRNLLEPGLPPIDPLDYRGNPGHGTRTCSILCGVAADGTRGGSPIGVAPRLPVVPYRAVESVVLARASQRAALADALRHAVDAGDCGVVSISLGFPTFVVGGDGGLGEAVDHAYERGVIVVAAGGQFADSVCYPAKYDRTIGVGGVKADRSVWFSYGQGGAAIDVWAPAFDVPRADGRPEPGHAAVPPTEPDEPAAPGGGGSFGSNSGSFGLGAGTSYATVHVAAAAAMWLLRHRDDLDRRYPHPWQRVEAFRHQIRAATTGINGPPPANGTGTLDIERVLLKGLPDPRSLRKAPADSGKVA